MPQAGIKAFIVDCTLYIYRVLDHSITTQTNKQTNKQTKTYLLLIIKTSHRFFMIIYR